MQHESDKCSLTTNFADATCHFAVYRLLCLLGLCSGGLLGGGRRPELACNLTQKGWGFNTPFGNTHLEKDFLLLTDKRIWPTKKEENHTLCQHSRTGVFSLQPSKIFTCIVDDISNCVWAYKCFHVSLWQFCVSLHLQLFFWGKQELPSPLLFGNAFRTHWGQGTFGTWVWMQNGGIEFSMELNRSIRLLRSNICILQGGNIHVSEWHRSVSAYRLVGVPWFPCGTRDFREVGWVRASCGARPDQRRVRLRSLSCGLAWPVTPCGYWF